MKLTSFLQDLQDRNDSALSSEPVFEVQIEDDAEEEEGRKADGDHVIVNFDFRNAHASYTPDTERGSKALRGQSGNRKLPIGTCLTPFLRAPYSGRSVV